MKKLVFSLLASMLWLLIFPIGVFAQSVPKATLTLDPASGTFNQGCNFSVNVNLDTGGYDTDGTDAILDYDPVRLTATSITNGTIYPDYPGNNIDPTGKITISGLASVSTPFKGTGTLATINFTIPSTALAGLTQVKFEFSSTDKSNTRDSNVVQRGTVLDVLNSVVDGNYTVGTGSCGATTPATPTNVVVLPNTGPTTPGNITPRGAVIVSTPAAQPKTLDQLVDRTGKGTGTPELTFTLAIVGSILTVLGVLGLALL